MENKEVKNYRNKLIYDIWSGHQFSMEELKIVFNLKVSRIYQIIKHQRNKNIITK